ncbi:hypothetical protein ACI65C_003533 [Semiaphis heraclei]
MDFDSDQSLKDWAKDKPLSILQLDPADRAVLRIADAAPSRPCPTAAGPSPPDTFHNVCARSQIIRHRLYLSFAAPTSDTVCPEGSRGSGFRDGSVSCSRCHVVPLREHRQQHCNNIIMVHVRFVYSLTYHYCAVIAISIGKSDAQWISILFTQYYNIQHRVSVITTTRYGE